MKYVYKESEKISISLNHLNRMNIYDYKKIMKIHKYVENIFF